MTSRIPDPTQAEPEPPFPEQEQEPPGREADMQPLADHGEHTYVGHDRLRDKVALITGADSGIGRAVALAFAREGADVLCSYWKEDEDAAETTRLVEEAGRRCIAVPGDIGDREHCRQLVERAVSSASCCSSGRYDRTTSAPSRAKAMATARPMPESPPVISVFLPASLFDPR